MVWAARLGRSTGNGGEQGLADGMMGKRLWDLRPALCVLGLPVSQISLLRGGGMRFAKFGPDWHVGRGAMNTPCEAVYTPPRQ